MNSEKFCESQLCRNREIKIEQNSSKFRQNSTIQEKSDPVICWKYLLRLLLNFTRRNSSCFPDQQQKNEQKCGREEIEFPTEHWFSRFAWLRNAATIRYFTIRIRLNETEKLVFLIIKKFIYSRSYWNLMINWWIRLPGILYSHRVGTERWFLSIYFQQLLSLFITNPPKNQKN